MMLTYNHAGFVAQALESALAQRVPFDYEIVVGDDASTDGTAAIVDGFAKRRPDVIRAVLRPSNIGGRRNFLDCYGRCRGEFVALLEGDDYWLSAEKLATQVAALDGHPEAMLAAHEGFNEYPDGSRLLYVKELFGRDLPGQRIELGDVVFHNFLPTCSLLFRREALRSFPDDVLEWPLLDWFLIVLLAQQGPVVFHGEPWGVRRAHPGGVMSMKPLSYKLEVTLRCIEISDRLTDGRFAREKKARMAECHWALATALAREKRPRGAVSSGIHALRLGHRPGWRGLLRLVQRTAYAAIGGVGGEA